MWGRTLDDTRHARNLNSNGGQRRSEGTAWSLRDFENGVPAVTNADDVADEKKRREYLNQAKVTLKRNSR